jgi:outer membrane protein TolC
MAVSGAELSNEDDTWGLDTTTAGWLPNSHDRRRGGLGLFGDALGNPDPGWFAGLQMRVPVTDGGARTGRTIEARAYLNKVRAALADRKDVVELAVRQSYKVLLEQRFRVELAQENVKIERERFQIEDELRNVGRITDDQLETFRQAFFNAQDQLFSAQETLVDRQEDLRLAIRCFR